MRYDANTYTNDIELRNQTDSTGYALWLPSLLLQAGALKPSRENLDTIVQAMRYLQAIDYAHQPDDGQWEEDSQLHTSSIAVAVSGLRAARRTLDEHSHLVPKELDIDNLTAIGERTIGAALPYETRPSQSYTGRFTDASHLFLVESLRYFEGSPVPAAEAIVRIEQGLARNIGVVRYQGDSYWAPGFTDILQGSERTTSAEGRLEKRDTLGPDAMRTKTEAQWTLFDSLLSAYYGRLGNKAKQIFYLNRALAQLVAKEDGSWQIPELFYTESGDNPDWKPNDHMPLKWSQANLLHALNVFEKTRQK